MKSLLGLLGALLVGFCLGFVSVVTCPYLGKFVKNNECPVPCCPRPADCHRMGCCCASKCTCCNGCVKSDGCVNGQPCDCEKCKCCPCCSGHKVQGK
jgi:hypothetical protein